jgi:hypothetical protein
MMNVSTVCVVSAWTALADEVPQIIMMRRVKFRRCKDTILRDTSMELQLSKRDYVMIPRVHTESNSLNIVLTKRCHRTCLKCTSVYSKTLTWLTCMYFQQATMHPSVSMTLVNESSNRIDSICIHARP